MNDRDIRLECLRLAQNAATMVGEKRDIVTLAQTFYDFVWSGAPTENRPGFKRTA